MVHSPETWPIHQKLDGKFLFTFSHLLMLRIHQIVASCLPIHDGTALAPLIYVAADSIGLQGLQGRSLFAADIRAGSDVRESILSWAVLRSG